ncbi:MAG: S46 family peptidase [Bacteroidales bacterium]|nr:S46 family peptidase [Bacteroidales bacterium]
MRRSSLAAALAALCLLASPCVRADEGMWMVNALSRAIVQNMEREGLQLPAGTIYDEEAVSIKDAIVSLDFGCTGSMVSVEGLLITNHHCAYSDVHALSTPEHNYLEDGFWAHTRAAEIPVPDKSAYFLKKVLDVTQEVEALVAELKASEKPFGMRKVSFVMERRYQTSTGLEASLSSMWAGSRYYMALYEVYTDIRLVAAPPVSVAAFGGDIDNWEWPQHKCDFALYRIYAGKDGKPAAYSSDNVPMRPARYLRISRKGVQPGDFTMVLGYPGRTDRYASSAKVRHLTGVALPISNEVRGHLMEIMKRGMDADPAVRLKYADRFFSLSNVQELQEGEVACCRRFGVEAEKTALERSYGLPSDLLQELDRKYGAIADAERNRFWYRETLIRGTRLSVIATRLHSIQRKPDPARDKKVRKSNAEAYAALDPALEGKLLRYCVEAYYEHVSPRYWGPFQKAVKERWGDDYDGLCASLWKGGEMQPGDSLYLFFNDVNIGQFNKVVDSLQGRENVQELGRRYTRALWAERERRGEAQYPDANSTMRLTYGTVRDYSPRDGVLGCWQSTHRGILVKADPSDYDFRLKPDWEGLLRGLPAPIPVNFLTDNDITGGNSGSPVLNARGELVGLAFDGNKESLASDVSFTPAYNRCICVDIRFVLWTLERYAGMQEVLKELG